MMRFVKSYHWLPLFICLLLTVVWTGQNSYASSFKPIGLVAVITDFGTTDFYVGAMQGAMYSANPQVRIATITHEVTPFSIAEGSYILAHAAREFPSGTVFLAVVDPGVGTERRPIVVETKDHKLFVAPDNGLLTGVMDAFGVAHAYEITNQSLMRPGKISATFHGRDVYGPVAAHLAGGTRPSEAGPEIAGLVRLPIIKAKRAQKALIGSVIHIDRYGNFITNITGKLAKEAGLEPGAKIYITINDQRLLATFTVTYDDVPRGDWLALINAEEVVEIARNMENAAQTIGAASGAKVRIENLKR
jgi:S-adenosylmethionine hydrolase